jgi:phosphoserine phosphatase RsbU/P
MLLLCTGILLGLLVIAVVLLGRAQAQREEAKRALGREKPRAIDFGQQMAAALVDQPARAELLQRIVHTAISCTGAVSAGFFERTADGQMRGAATEGLFPPQRPLPVAVRGNPTTRAKLLDQALQFETIPAGEGIVGQVVSTGQGVLIADAAAAPDIVQHDDPALAVRSLIAVPLCFGERVSGVLAVANPANGGPFTPTDFALLQSLAVQAALVLRSAGLPRQ